MFKYNWMRGVVPPRLTYSKIILLLTFEFKVLPFYRAQNNGRSTDNARPDRGLDQSNSRLAGHFGRSFLDACRLMRFAL